jgi:hypothetical protein
MRRVWSDFALNASSMAASARQIDRSFEYAPTVLRLERAEREAPSMAVCFTHSDRGNVPSEMKFMSMHRLKCRNGQCGFEGVMEAKSDRPFAKKSFVDKHKADLKSRGIAAAPDVMQLRCPKCGSRWRMRVDQLR